VEDETRNGQKDFRVAPDWRYTLEPLRRPTVKVTMKHGRHERVKEVPEGTSEEGMKQLLVSGFGVDIRGRWRVISRTPMGRTDPYELKRSWSYELFEYAPPAIETS
jgi:hypothetical protein